MILLWRIIAVLSLAEFFSKKKRKKNEKRCICLCICNIFGNSLIHPAAAA